MPAQPCRKSGRTSRAKTAILATGRSTPKRFATGAVRDRRLALLAPGLRRPDTAASTRGSIWPRLGAHENIPRISGNEFTHIDRHVMQASLRRHPSSGTVGTAPASTQPTVNPNVSIEPGVAIGCGDPFRLTPLQ